MAEPESKQPGGECPPGLHPGDQCGTWFPDGAEQAAQPAEPPAAVRRPHWLPEEAWLGVIVGQWPLRAFPDQQQAERWAAAAAWDMQGQRYEQRRIWQVEIPAGTQTFTVEKIPASTKLVEVQP